MTISVGIFLPSPPASIEQVPDYLRRLHVMLQDEHAQLATAINGAISTHGSSVACVNGLNSNVVPPAGSWIRITGPTAAYSVGGFTLRDDGRWLVIYNATAYAMTIVNEDASSTAANRIKTLTGANVVLRTGPSAATLIYDATDSRWILVSTN